MSIDDISGGGVGECGWGRRRGIEGGSISSTAPLMSTLCSSSGLTSVGGRAYGTDDMWMAGEDFHLVLIDDTPAVALLRDSRKQNNHRHRYRALHKHTHTQIHTHTHMHHLEINKTLGVEGDACPPSPQYLTARCLRSHLSQQQQQHLRLSWHGLDDRGGSDDNDEED